MPLNGHLNLSVQQGLFDSPLIVSSSWSTSVILQQKKLMDREDDGLVQIQD
jgi:hypothetical protein